MENRQRLFTAWAELSLTFNLPLGRRRPLWRNMPATYVVNCRSKASHLKTPALFASNVYRDKSQALGQNHPLWVIKTRSDYGINSLDRLRLLHQRGRM
jgi:hypothetical protein